MLLERVDLAGEGKSDEFYLPLYLFTVKYWLLNTSLMM